MPILIVGLGNPGKDYAATRHNAGFLALDALAGKLGLSWKSDHRANADVIETNVTGKKVILVKPQTFMNRSGDAVASLAANFNVAPNDVWVAYDEVSIPLGTLRIRAEGSAGGHNGMKSIIAALGTEVFPRFRIGIGPQPENVPLEDFVLSRFTTEERDVIRNVATQAAVALLDALERGVTPTTT